MKANFAHYADDNTLYGIGNNAKEAAEPLKDVLYDLFCLLPNKQIKTLSKPFVGNGLLKVQNLFVVKIFSGNFLK